MSSRGTSSLSDSVFLRLRAPARPYSRLCCGSAPHPPPRAVGCVPTPSHGVLIPTAEKHKLRDGNNRYDCLQQIFLDLITQTVY